uniref:Uncharacterized protein n=1 Tax=Branchiostoma floridae TaxID=7739 RepID=C3ZMX2_BRAFL|eukprot:XP_002590101.1 hypothetical protein BRAFLDRAFT_83379 [Branchiostoma floridae]
MSTGPRHPTGVPHDLSPTSYIETHHQTWPRIPQVFMRLLSVIGRKTAEQEGQETISSYVSPGGHSGTPQAAIPAAQSANTATVAVPTSADFNFPVPFDPLLTDLDKAPTFPLPVFHMSTGAFLWNHAEMGSISPPHPRRATPAVTVKVLQKRRRQDTFSAHKELSGWRVQSPTAGVRNPFPPRVYPSIRSPHK